MLKKLLFAFLFLLLLIVGYYTVVIIKARMDTPSIVQKALNAEHITLQLRDLSVRQKQILLTIQDPKFYQHNGVDGKTPGAGKTTITQGLVKFYYFDRFERGIQKIKQTLIARFAFDPLVPKDTQLLLFINEMYLGVHEQKQIKGLEDAAQAYYKKPFKQLNEDEYLSLIAMIRNPTMFHVLKNQEKNKARVDRIKKVLAGQYVPKDNSDQFYDR